MKKVVGLCVIFVAVVMFFSVSVGANGIPKMSVVVNFDNMDDEPCYATLLSSKESNRYYSVWDGDESTIDSSVDREIWMKFVEFKDEDGFYFWGRLWKISETKKIVWVGLPPSEFKLLIYYPESDNFEISDAYSIYAVSSYFDVDMLSFENGMFVAQRNYRWLPEIAGLLIRMAATIVIEMLIAAAFGFWNSRVRRLLIAVNVSTQILINVALNIIHYKLGDWEYFKWYLILELAVVAVESVIYCISLRNREENPKNSLFYVKYAAAANAVSFIVGFAVGKLSDLVLK